MEKYHLRNVSIKDAGEIWNGLMQIMLSYDDERTCWKRRFDPFDYRKIPIHA